MQITCKVNQAEAIKRGFNSHSTIKLRIAKGIVRNRLSRAPWAGGWGHYAVVDKQRWHWETVCHVSASDAEFEVKFTAAIERLASRVTTT